MNAPELTAFRARLLDILEEAREELDDAAFEDLLVIAADEIARRVSGRIEARWQS